MLKIILNFCKANNLVFGITDNTLLQPKGYAEGVPFITLPLEDRINPLLQMEDCKSIIVILRNYKVNTYRDINKPHIASPNQYYIYQDVLGDKLKELCDLLKTDDSVECKTYCDGTGLLERELAVKSGLGYFSKNTNIMNEEFGTCFNIGYIMINKEIPYDAKIKEENCGDCTICEKACPTGAINGDYTINHKKCISAINQRKGDLTEEEKDQISNYIYGCNICTKICPKNKDNRFYEEDVLEYTDFLNNTNKQFLEKFKDKGFVWRGNSILSRNAEIAMERVKNGKMGE